MPALTRAPKNCICLPTRIGETQQAIAASSPQRSRICASDSYWIEEVSIEIDPGKILEVRLQTVGETNEEGDVRVFFELNGQPRMVRVPNRKAAASAPKRPKADTGNPAHVAAPMPGVIASVAVKDGQPVQAGDLMLTIEAMKMETGLHAERAGTVKALHVQPGAQVDAKDLLVELAVA